MEIVNGVPTFVYRDQEGITHPVLEPYHTSTGYAPLFGVMYGAGLNESFHDIVIAQTPVINLIAEGAEAIHRALNIDQSRFSIQVHLGLATYKTAELLGLKW